jgi:predicted homoserine dehydrogenase-like protein
VPIGLLDGSRIVRNVEKGQTLTWADVEPKQGLALEAALALRERMRGGLGVAAARD